MGGASGGSDECLRRAMRATASFSEMAKQLGNRSDYNMDANKVSDAKATAAEQVAAVVKQHYNVSLAPEHASAIARAASGEKGIVLNAQQDTLVGVMGQVMSNYTGVGFVGTTHTADFVTSTAFGPGCEHFEGLLRNTDVFQKLTTLMDTPFKNPTAEGRPTATASHTKWEEPAFWLA